MSGARSIRRVGLTGGMASGKSTVAQLLAEEGLRVVDADRLVAELYGPGGEGSALVRGLFGPELLTDDGSVDRPRVAERIFSDPGARRELEEAIHPLVRRRFAAIAEAEDGPTVLEATLLVEAGYGPDFDLVVSVEAPEQLRLARAIERGMSAEEARGRLAAQGDGARRRAGADRILTNDGTPEELKKKVTALAEEIHQSQQ